VESLNIVELVGLVGTVGSGLLGVYFALKALGLFQYLGGKRAKSWAVPVEELRERLLTSDDEMPFEVKDGSNEGTDLIVEWKLADARWFGIFSRSRLKVWYKGYMLLDDYRKSVRYYEESGRIYWKIGVRGLIPVFEYSKERFGGRVLFQKSYSKSYGVRDDGSFGEVYSYSFDASIPRNHVREVVEECGWEFVPVVSKRFIRRGKPGSTPKDS